MAIESEIASWRRFRDGLASEEERKAFDEVIDMCRVLSSVANRATNPALFEPMIMSVLLGQQKRIRTLQRKIDALLVAMLPIENAGAGNLAPGDDSSDVTEETRQFLKD